MMFLMCVLLQFCAQKAELEGDTPNMDGSANRSWNDGSSIVIHYDSTITPKYAAAFDEAIEIQQSVLASTTIRSEHNLVSSQGPADALDYDDFVGDGLNSVYATYADLPSTALNPSPDALTFQRFVNDRIVEFDIVIHAPAFPNVETRVTSYRDLIAVALHEASHGLGIPHGEGIMQPKVNATLLRDPFPSSYCQQLAALYTVKNCDF